MLFKSFPRKGMETTMAWLTKARSVPLFKSFPRKGMETGRKGTQGT